MEDDKYIISFDKLPSCIYREHNDVITQFTFPTCLVPASNWLKRGETVVVNDKNYTIKDRVDIMGYIILKCLEDER